MKSSDYKQLKKQIEERYAQTIAAARKQRDDGLAAIETVWNMLHAPRKKDQDEHIPVDGIIQDNSSSSTKKYGSLKANVVKALEDVPETFTSTNVTTMARQLSGIKYNAGSISNRLKHLAAEGIIEMVEQGRGKSPTVYRKCKVAEVKEIKTVAG